MDDAIVVVENIHRHMARDGKSLIEAIPPAVDEVGDYHFGDIHRDCRADANGICVGLDGPVYAAHSGECVGEDAAVMAIALIVTPWLSLKLLARHGQSEHAEQSLKRNKRGWLHRLFERVMSPF